MLQLILSDGSIDLTERSPILSTAWKIPLMMKKLFAEMQSADQKAVTTEDVTWAFGKRFEDALHVICTWGCRLQAVLKHVVTQTHRLG